MHLYFTSLEVEICEMIEITSSGGAKTYHHERLGIYKKQKDLVHGRNAYKHEHRNQYIFWIPGNQDGRWWPHIMWDDYDKKYAAWVV